MRVITGIAKGKRLDTLEGMDVRPTTDRVKEGMFSSIQFDLENTLVLDLFAGSGQLGIEALSRGARSAVFVDNSKKSLEVVKANLEKTNLTDKAMIVNMNSLDFLKLTDKKFDFIFLDPPYNKGILLEVLPLLKERLNSYGKIICEHEKNLDLPKKVGDLRLKKSYKYGKINISMYLFDREDE